MYSSGVLECLLTFGLCIVLVERSLNSKVSEDGEP